LKRTNSKYPSRELLPTVLGKEFLRKKRPLTEHRIIKKQWWPKRERKKKSGVREPNGLGKLTCITLKISRAVVLQGRSLKEKPLRKRGDNRGQRGGAGWHARSKKLGKRG